MCIYMKHDTHWFQYWTFISNLWEKKPQHQTLSSLSNTLVHAIALASSGTCWIHTNLFMTLTTFTTKMCNVLLVRMRLTHINMQMESTGHFTGWWKRKKQTKRFSIDLKSDRSKTTSHQKYRKQENSLSFWAWASTKWLK